MLPAVMAPSTQDPSSVGRANFRPSASRGGISKRRTAGRARLDRDGDLIMDLTPTSTERGRKDGRKERGTSVLRQRISNGGARRRQELLAASARTRDLIVKPSVSLRSANTATVTLQVTGLSESKAAANADGGINDLISFLQRKARSVAKRSNDIRIKKSRFESPFFYILVSKDDSEAIKMLEGFMFAGAKLSFAEVANIFVSTPAVAAPVATSPTVSKEVQAVKDIILAILHARYNVEAKYLDLSNLHQYEDLNKFGLLPPNAMPQRLFHAIMKVCNETFATPQAKREAVQVISLAGNYIQNASEVFLLVEAFPDLQKLDLSRNSIANTAALEPWRNHLQQLDAILLLDNPICGQPQFGSALLGWWPRLQSLNHLKARSPEEVVVALNTGRAQRQPQPIPQGVASWFSDGSGIGENFLEHLIAGYDTDRPKLASMYYDADSVFSLSVDTNGIPSRLEGETPLAWTPYIKLSKNLLKITTAIGRLERTFRGPAEIAEVWQALPLTKHPNPAIEPHKYRAESAPLRGIPDPTNTSPTGVVGLDITLSGEFDELDKESGKSGKRSFTRAFVLGPGKTPAQPVRVISDMLSLRCYRALAPV